MIRLRNNIYEDYFIDPETAIITDKNGVVQETTIKNGRPCWKGNPICKFQMHTHVGYLKNMHIHHIDKNKLNDALSNLIYLTPQEHAKLHANNRDEGYNKKISSTVKKMMTPEYRKKISELTKAAMTEEVKEKIRQSRLGKKASEETKEKLRNRCKNNPRFSTAGFSWWNNGYENRFCKECPDGFFKGRIKKRPNK